MKKSQKAWIAVSLASALVCAGTVTWAASSGEPLPRYLTKETLNKLRLQRGEPAPVLNSFVHSNAKDKTKDAASAKNATRVAQVPPPANGEAKAPAAVKKKADVTIPQWVRYPFEFQLCGIGLGSKAVDKDSHNRIDRYGLFAIHGNPTAIVVPGGVSVNQQPPEVAALFPGSANGHLPSWAAAVTVQLDDGHVEWLYRRETYSMGFVVDRLGFVDAIVLAGTYSDIGETQLEAPKHSIELGDDLRKVLFRYGYPDDTETYSINVAAGASTGGGRFPATTATAPTDPLGGPMYQANPQMLPPAPGMGAPGMPGAPGANVAAGGGGTSNAAFRTFELRYDQSYNVVFSIRNNRVVRIYIFGDPDFFTQETRKTLRTEY